MVEWKKLGDLLDYEQPTSYLVNSTEYDESYDVPVLTAGQSLLLGYTNETEGIYQASKTNPTIIFDDFTTSFHWIDYKFKVKSSAMKMLRPKKDVNFRYVYYAMLGINFVPGGHQRHWISKYSNLEIPIPSLSEQSRIVSILDTFTSSISNLKQQIEERRKQYEYERDLLLDLEGKEGVEMKKLGEVFSFKNGLNKGKEFFGKCKPIIMFTNVFNSRFITKAMIKSRVDISEQELERINAQIGDVFFTRTSETKEDVGYASVLVEDMEECTFAGFLIRARPITHKMLPQYCKYCFSTPKVRNAIVSKSSFTTRASLTGSGLGEVIIPLPPLSTQSRIVSILDTFEQSIANLEEQLAMREKQYEYYREKLLRFEEA